MDDYLAANRARWDEMATHHPNTEFYDVAAFKRGETRLHDIELAELGGEVAGRSLLHLQCHFGLDTLSWARLGARVTGVDFSEVAIATARDLAAQCALDARWVCCDVYSLPDHLDETFDVVFTSYGAITWLPEIARWADVVAHFLTPGGTFYIAEFHPFAWVFDDEADGLQPRYPYLQGAAPEITEWPYDYADRSIRLEHATEYVWNHPLGAVVTSLVAAGLRIEYLHEFDRAPYQMLPVLVPDPDHDRWWRLADDQPRLALMYTLRATKPA
jgi:SAM-dependent methyltransferase